MPNSLHYKENETVRVRTAGSGSLLRQDAVRDYSPQQAELVY